MSSKNILVVDDSDMERELVITSLKLIDNSHTILQAENGLEASNIFKDNDIDLVITDVVMPEMDGLELVKFIRQECSSQTPIIVTSGDPLYKKILTVSKLLGMEDFIEKGFSPEDLKDAVEKHLA